VRRWWLVDADIIDSPWQYTGCETDDVQSVTSTAPDNPGYFRCFRGTPPWRETGLGVEGTATRQPVGSGPPGRGPGAHGSVATRLATNAARAWRRSRPETTSCGAAIPWARPRWMACSPASRHSAASSAPEQPAVASARASTRR